MRSSLNQRVREPVVPERPVALDANGAVRSETFPQAGPAAWLDRPDALAAIDAQLASGTLSPEQARIARDYSRDGVVVLPRFFDPARLAVAWNAYEAALADGRITVPAEPIAPEDTLPGRALNPHQQVPEVRALLHDPRLVEVVEFLLGARVRPFQTIIGHKGSQQREHSDSIHMTTYPLGYLAGAWIALEDIHPDSGPLTYYPGSHRLPYIFARDVGITLDDFATTGYQRYHELYEPAVANAVSAAGLAPRYFEARAGDVLLWHANIVHAGSARRDPRRSRKALVCHYFADGCICYHDLAARVANFGSPAS